MDIIARYSALKSTACEIQEYIKTIADRTRIRDTQGKPQPDAEANLASRVASGLTSCANYLVFHDYHTIDQRKLVKARTCKQHLVCPFCAKRRAGKMMAQYVQKIDQVLSESPSLKPIMITLTVKNGSDLAERFNHMNSALKRLLERRRDWIKKGWGKTEFRKLDGLVYSCEFTFNPDTGWNPHVHILTLAHDWIDREALSSEWKSVTGDSFIVDVRRIKNKSTNIDSGSDMLAGIAEVMKYALKFSDLPPDQVWTAYTTLRGKRLMGSVGSLRGVQIPDSLLDDPLEDLPYTELFYIFSRSQRTYHLKSATNVEANTSELADSGPDGMENPTPPEETTVKGGYRRAEPGSPLTGVYLGGVHEPMPPEP